MYMKVLARDSIWLAVGGLVLVKIVEMIFTINNVICVLIIM